MNLTRDDIHRLVDSLPEGDLTAVGEYLQSRQTADSDALLNSLMAAPWDDEPESPEEAAAVREAYEDVRNGNLVSDEELDSLLKE